MGTAAPLTADRVLRRLEWHVIRRLDGRLQGNYRTLLRGHGTDFRDVREYEVGDDVRHVDWNVTARMDEMFVRQYTEDRELTAWLLLDHSASMSFGPTHRTKERVLSEVAATIAQLLVRTGNKIGAIVYDNDVVRTIPPRQGRPQVLRLLDELLRPAGGGGMVTDLRKLLDTAARQIRRRSLVVIVSDFISEPGWERSLLRLTERHEVVAVRLVDPRELELPDAGLLVVQDAETGEQLMVDSSDPVFRRRLRDAGEARAEAVRAGALGAGVDLHVISTDDDLVTAFVRIVDSRKRPRR
ncbi:MAG TPA: DUF58 domain-containing protein [Acidimicrobiales bacterium]|nr:DUF58 domain-containing protein [Acidimicrobiales bacterium]